MFTLESAGSGLDLLIAHQEKGWGSEIPAAVSSRNLQHKELVVNLGNCQTVLASLSSA